MMNSQLFTPDYSPITGLLQHLNDEELKELLNSEEKLKNIVSDLKQVHDIEAEKEMLIASNKSISEYNLSKEPILELHRKQVAETHQIAVELRNTFLEKKKKIENNGNGVSKETILALLQAATSEVEEEAEASVEVFLKNEISIEDFLGKYLELKKISHLRRIKAEKLTNMLRGDLPRNLSPPDRPRRLRTPPAPPAPRSPLPYPDPFPRTTHASFNYGPVRTAPLPPRVGNIPQQANMFNQNQPQAGQTAPFPYMPGHYPGYFMPQAYPSFK